MRRIFKKWWNRYRHFRAGHGLAQDLLSWLGWWQPVVAIIVGLVAWIKARLSNLAGVEQFVLGLLAFAAALVILDTGLPLLQRRRIRWPWARSYPKIEYEIWHGGYGQMYPKSA